MKTADVIRQIRKERLVNLNSRLAILKAVARVLPTLKTDRDEAKLTELIAKIAAFNDAENVFSIEELRAARQARDSK